VILLVIAGISFGVLALTWLVYPLVMWLRARASAAPAAGAPTDRVAVIIATRDAPESALARVRNILQTDYPAHLVRVFVSVDRGSAFPIDAYRQLLAGTADVVAGDQPGGKACNLNAGTRAGLGGADVFVFADVGQEFNSGAIRHMVLALQDARFGGVAGLYTQNRDDSVMAAYARLEAVIRAGQASSHSVVSTSGSIYAIRAALWQELPAGLICDDLYTTLSIVRQGRRVGFSVDAIAFDPRTFTREQQFARRVRTLTGLIQYGTLQGWAFRPWSNPIWIHLVMHKVLRLLTPIPLAVGSVALFAWLLLTAPRFLLVVSVAVFVMTGAVAIAAPRRFRQVADQVAWLLRLQLVPGFAIANGLSRRWGVWTPTPQGDGRSAGAGA
jgi:cellulose synthase/poly-beta-1,6-N-acetylglucosamine synthase-like glycosyltransferase